MKNSKWFHLGQLFPDQGTLAAVPTPPQHKQQRLQPQEGTWKPPTETTPTRNSRLPRFIFVPKANPFGKSQLTFAIISVKWC